MRIMQNWAHDRDIYRQDLTIWLLDRIVDKPMGEVWQGPSMDVSRMHA